MPSSKKKQKKLMKRAQKQTTSTALSTANPSAVSSIGRKRAQRLHASIAAKYESRWLAMHKEIEVSYDREDWAEVERKVDALYDDIATIHTEEWKRLTGQEPIFDQLSVFPRHKAQYYYRGHALFERPVFVGAIQDYTEAETFTQEQMKLPRSEYVFDKLEEIQMDILASRGTAFCILGDFDRAIVDLRAACAAFLTIRQEGWTYDRDSAGKEPLGQLLVAFAGQKLGASRPHHTVEERRKIEKELQINIYSHEEYCCTGCGAAERSEITLRLCARCQRAWFCSRECQEQAWETEHKQVCSKKTRPHFAHDDEKEVVEKSFEDDGVLGAWGEGRCFHVLVRDTATGRLFESLTDRDMYFLPSELKLVPKKFKADAELFVAARSTQDLTL